MSDVIVTASGADKDKGKSKSLVADIADEVLLKDPGKATISKHQTRHRSLSDNYLDSKAAAPGANDGYIEGYASKFDEIDHQGEVVRKGAFTKTIAEQDGKIVLSAKHFARGGDLEHAVATVVDLKEDDYGLWFKAVWHNDDASQRIRQKVVELRARGTKVASSIGYRPVKWGWIRSPVGDASIMEHTEIALKEITLTLNPACDGAIIIDAKEDNGENKNGAGSSGAEDGRAQEEPLVAKGTAVATVKEGDVPAPKTARTTVTEADTHSADARVISIKASHARIRAKLDALKRKP